MHLEEAQETLRAIRTGDVDAVVVSGSKGEQVYLISGAERPYRVFLDKMKSMPELTDVATDRESAGPMLNVTVNRDVASSFGILPSTIDNTLDDAFGQRIASTIYSTLNQYRVILEVAPQFYRSPITLRSTYPHSTGDGAVRPDLDLAGL